MFHIPGGFSYEHVFGTRSATKNTQLPLRRSPITGGLRHNQGIECDTNNRTIIRMMQYFTGETKTINGNRNGIRSVLIHAVGELAKTMAVLRARGIATSQLELHAAAEALQGHLGQIVRAEDASEVRSVMTPPAGFDVRPTQSQFPPTTFLHSETNDEMPLTRTDLAHQEPSRAQSARTVTSTASVNVMQPPLPPLQSATPPTAGGRLTCSVCKIFFKGSQVYRRFLEDHPDRRIECSACESQRKEA